MSNKSRKLAVFACSVALLVATMASPASAAVTSASVQLTDPTPGASGNTYTWTWNGYTSGATTRCVLITFSANADGSGGIPTGMVLTSATMAGTYGTGGTWTRDSHAGTMAGGTVVFNYGTGVAPASGPTTIVLGSITNPTNAAGGTFYMTVSAYTTAGAGNSGTCGGGLRDAAYTAAFETTTAQQASVTVDPSLSLVIDNVAASTSCGDVSTTAASTANAIPFGRVAAITAHPIVGQNLTVTTNASGGYTTYLSSSGVMTGGTTAGTIANMSGSNASPGSWPSNGTAAFGYTTESTSLSGTAARFDGGLWAGPSTTPYEIMRNTSTPGPSGDTNCIAFQVSIAGDTKADTYTTSIRYNVAASF